MRVHTNLTEADIRAALTACKERGQIAQGVQFTKLKEYASKSAARAFEVQMGTAETNLETGEKRRRVNAYGVKYELGFSATWSEWGWLIAELFVRDITCSWPAVGFYSREAFDEATLYAFSRGTKHKRVPVSDLVKGDTVIGSNVHGTGAKHVVWIRNEDNGSRTVSLASYTPRGAAYQREFTMAAKRVVTVLS